MAQCPICSKSISITEDNYGTLYRCEHCQSEFFIGFDGMPENSKEPLVIEPEIPPQSLESQSNQTPIDIFNIQSSEQDSSQQEEIDSSIALENKPENDLPSDQNHSEEVTEQNSSTVFQDFSRDVRDFGNDSAAIGILSFDIEITGIDLGDLKSELIEALDDKRFGWNVQELNQNIREGKLTIKNISAPQIIVLVKRITPIGLGLNWRHHVSTQ